jgi:trehalose-6-phosphate hydrolase
LITYGDYQLILPDHPQIFAYIRNGKDEKLLVVNNFYGKPAQFKWPEEEVEANFSHAELLISNYPDAPQDYHAFTLRPYESIVYHLTK